jgi:enediyne polyketide synthase
MSVAGIPFKYIAADVADLEAVSSAVREAEKEFGPVTAILHGAGTNVPRLLNSMDEAALLRTLAPKVQGLRNVLAAVNPDGLRLLVTFGSIIARAGMRGEADYALANEWLARLTEQFQSQHPACRCLAVEWSVWSGVGMGERLGRVDALVREGIMPIAADEGQAVLRRLIAQPLREVSVVVAGRFGESPTLRLEKQELPFLRFLEQPRVFYPGIELVVDAELSSDADPYVDDHVFQGARLFPAVMGLEAMAQVSMALLDIKEPPVFEDVTLSRPVIVPENSTRAIRLAALVRGPDSVEVALRSDETSFQVDHFRAVCRFGIHGSTAQARTESSQPSPSEVAELMPVGLNPDRDLYGEILFHQGRFRRLRSYKLLRATECLAEIAPSESTDWFGHYLPGGLLLGDPGARDAAIHAVQACIPHATLFPMGVDRLTLDVEPNGQPRFVYARERSREGDTFTYDLEVSGEDGCVRERWEGLRLRVVDHRAGAGSWVEPLLGPYVERRINELVPGSTVSVLMERNPGGERPLMSDRAIQRALGTAAPIRRRPDGKPEVIGEPQIEVSAAHTADLTFVVAGPGPLGCDIEHAMARPVSIWRELLGHDRFALAEVISHHAGEDETAAATRVWAASECLKKAGASLNAPLTLASSEGGGWVKLSAGPLVVATLVTQVRDVQKPLALAVLLSGSNGGQQVRW